MKRTLGILMAIIATFAAVFALTACADTSGIQSDLDRLTGAVTDLTDKVNDLTSENKALTDKVNDLTSENKTLTDKVGDLTTDVNDLTIENGALKDRVEGLNVFTTDKAEYGEHETMTVYFKNQPVLKIRISFENINGTALWGNTFNCRLYITSLCASIYDELIVGTTFIAWDRGTCARKQFSNVNIIKQNEETGVGGYFTDTEEAYAEATWFDLVICVPGTPFELARFKNVSVYRPQ